MTRTKRQFFASAREVEDHVPCRYCPARIVWIKTEAGRAMPLDYDSRQPVIGGGFVLDPHWATCPGAQDARARAKRRRADH